MYIYIERERERVWVCARKRKCVQRLVQMLRQDWGFRVEGLGFRV